MRQYYELATYERDSYTVVVDHTAEDLAIRDCFDDSVHDIADLCDKVNRGIYDWFILRVRVIKDSTTLEEDTLGGCMYESATDVLTDGTAEDLIQQALKNAKSSQGISAS